MAVSLLAHEISDLCLGKPALRFLPLSATVADALAALKISDDHFLSVWDCRNHDNHSPESAAATGDECYCRCVGKVCTVDVICYLCRDDNLLSPSTALTTPVSDLLPKIPGLVTHLEPSSSLLEAIDVILQGAQNLVVPIKRRQSTSSRRKQQQQQQPKSLTTTHNGREFCWLTQEDVVRFLLSSIGLFSPIPALSIDSLGIITSDDAVLSTDYHSPAISALSLISRSLTEQTSVAVVDADGVLIGEISPLTLASCDETAAAAAVSTLSAGDLMAYIDGGSPPEDLVRVVNRRLKERNPDAIVEDLTVLSSQSSLSSSFSSSDEESSLASPKTTLARLSSRSGGRYSYSRSASYSARMVRRAEAIVCHRKSSLVAVMIQAIAHRVNYVWVVDDDSCLVGIVTFSAILKVFREYATPS